MKVDKNLKDQMLFIKKFVTEPRTIGSVTPSSPQLVDSMLQNADWAKLGAVAELGAGTGVMTRAIIERKAKECELLVFEIEEELRKNLEDETGFEIYADDAPHGYIFAHAFYSRNKPAYSADNHVYLDSCVGGAV